MKSLRHVAPEVHGEFVRGNFVVKKASRKFNQVSPDLALEKSANRDGKTSGGITGITMREESLRRHYVILAETAEIVTAVKGMSHVTTKFPSWAQPFSHFQGN